MKATKKKIQDISSDIEEDECPKKKIKKQRSSTEYELPSCDVKAWIEEREKEGLMVHKIVVVDDSMRSMGLGAFYFANEKSKKPDQIKTVAKSKSTTIDMTQKNGPVILETSSDTDEEIKKTQLNPSREHPWGRFIVSRASIFDALEDNAIYVKRVRSQKNDKLLRCVVANMIRRKSWFLENKDCCDTLKEKNNRYIIEQQLGNARLLSGMEIATYGYILGRLHERGLGIEPPMVFRQSASDKLKICVDETFDPHEEFDKAVAKYIDKKLKKFENRKDAKSYVSTIKGWNQISDKDKYARLFNRFESNKKFSYKKKSRAKKKAKNDDVQETEGDEEIKNSELGPYGIPVDAEKSIRYRINKQYAVVNGTKLIKILANGLDKFIFKDLLKFLERAKLEGRKLDDFFDCLLHALYFVADHWCVAGESSKMYHKYVKSSFQAAGKAKKRSSSSKKHDDSSSEEDTDESECDNIIDPNADL